MRSQRDAAGVSGGKTPAVTRHSPRAGDVPERDWRMDYLRLRHQTRKLMRAAEAVNEGVMDNGLAFKRHALRDQIGTTLGVIKRLDGADGRHLCAHGFAVDECEESPSVCNYSAAYAPAKEMRGTLR